MGLLHENWLGRIPVFAAMFCFVAVFPVAAQQADPEEAGEKAAIGRFLSILEKNPRRGTTLDRIYGHHVERGSLDQMMKAYRDKVATSAEREAGATWMIVGLLESLRGQDAAAVVAFSHAERLDPTNSLAPYYRGQSLVLVGQPEKAAEAFEVALTRKPAQADLLEVFEALGRVYQRAQQPEQALQVWNRLEKLFPNDLRVQEQIATTLLEEGEFAAALPRFENLVKRVRDKYRQSLFQIEAAEIKVRLGQRDEAVRDFEHLLGQLNPDNWLFREVRRRVENVFLRTDDQTGLIAYYESWLKKHPEDLDAVSRLARLLARLGRGPESQALLEKALKAAPSKKPLRHALITQLLYEQKYSAAIAQYELMDTHEPNNPDTLREWGRLILKDTARDEATRKQAAAAVWRRLLAARPKDPLVVSQVAELFRQVELVDPALELYRKAVELAPDDAQYKEYLGEYYHSLQRKDEALATWRSIIAGKSKTAANMARLAEVLAGFGYLGEAIETNAEACQIDPKEINRQIKQADLLSQAERHDEALKQLAVVQKFAASDEEREAWLIRELKELQSVDKLKERIAEVRKGIESLAATTGDKVQRELGHQWFWLARAHEGERQWKEAAEAVTKAAELAPQSIPILIASARIMESQSNLLGAVEINNRLAAVDRRFRTEYLKKVAKLEVMLGRRDNALAAGREIIAAAPGNPEVYEFFSQLCFQLGEREEGLQALRRAVRVAPGELKGLFSLAGALAEQFRTDEAIELYWRAFDKAGNLDDRLVVVPRLAELYLQSNQFDRLLERLERQRREPNLQREMTICLAQAHQSAGDDGNARLELEKLLTEETRDTQLLTQLVKLCESDGDLDVAIRYQQQMNKVTPGKDGILRLAQLLLKEGEIEEANALMVQVATEEKDPEQVLKSIDSLLSTNQREQALRILQKLAREQPRNWELLYREGATLANDKPDESARRFEALLALTFEDDEPSLAAQSAAKRAARLPPAQLATAGIDLEVHTLDGRQEHVRSIRAAIPPNHQGSMFAHGGQQSPVWVPGDFGQARLASWGWLLSLARQRGKLDEFYKQKKESLGQSTHWRDLIDLYYLTCVHEDAKEQYKVLKGLSLRPGAGREIREMYLTSLPDRGPAEAAEGDETAPQVQPESATMPQVARDDDDDDNLAPLSNDELEHVIQIVNELQSVADKIHRRESYLELVVTELQRSGRNEEAEKMFADAVAAAKEPMEIHSVLQSIIEQGDYDTAIRLIDQLAELAVHGNARRVNTSGRRDYTQLLLSANYQVHFLGQLMSKRVAKNKTDMAKDPVEGVFELWKRYVRRTAVTPVVAANAGPQHVRSSNQVQFNFSVWNSDGEQLGETIDFPAPNQVYDEASIQLLLQMFVLYREADRPEALIEVFAATLQDPQTPGSQRPLWQFGLGYLQWWNGDRDEAFATLVTATETIADNTELKMGLARLHENRQQYAAAIQLIDALSPTDQVMLQRREVMALRLAVHSGNTDRARMAAARLFGLRLDTHLQMALARQMHQLGMHRQAEAILARAGRQAGNKTDVLLNLMEQYSSAGKTDVAVQIAHQLLRRTKPSSPNLYSHHHLFSFHGWSRDDGASTRTQALQVLNRSGKLPEMIAKVEAQLKITQKSQRLLETLIEYHTASGNEKQVEELNERLSESRIDDPRFRHQLAMKLLRSGRTNEAIEQLAIVIQKDPRLVLNDFGSLQNSFRGEEQDEFARLMELIDIKAFRQDANAITAAIRQLLSHEPTRDRALALFKRAWLDLPDAHDQFLAGVAHDDDFWQLPDVFDYARQGIIPSELTVQDERWYGLGGTISQSTDGRIATLGNRVLDLAAAQNKLDSLSDEVANAVKRMPGWTGGKVLSALIELRRGRVDVGRATLEAMLPALSKVNGITINTLAEIQHEIGQELMAHESCIDLAIRYFELSVTNNPQTNTEFESTASKPLLELLKQRGRTKDAHKVLIRVVEALGDPDGQNRVIKHPANAIRIGDEFRKLGHHADAIKLYQRALSNERALRNRSDEQTVKRLRGDLTAALTELKPESIVELLTPPPKPKPKPQPSGNGLFRSRRRPQSKVEHPDTESQTIDLMLLLVSPNLTQSKLSSVLVDLIGEIGSKPALFDQAASAIAAIREQRPDDIGAAILAAHLALVSNREATKKGRVNELVAVAERVPLATPPDKGTIHDKQRAAALQQVPLWLIARSCLNDNSVHAQGEKLAARALAAARLQSDNGYTILILREWGQLALEAGDQPQAGQLWTSMLEQVLAPPEEIARQPRRSRDTADSIQIATFTQVQQAAQIARLAADQGLIELSLHAMAQALHGGPALSVIQDPDQNDPFGQQQQSHLNSQAVTWLYQHLMSLEQIWRKKGVADERIYELVRGTVFPKSPTHEMYLYAIPLSESSHHLPHSVGCLLVKTAIQAGKTDDLKSAAELQLKQPFGELPARVLLGQLALAMHDSAGANQHLKFLSERLKRDSLQHTSELACHVALPAMDIPDLRPVAVELVAQAVDHWHKSIQTRRGVGQPEPVTSLTFLLARHYFQDGKKQDAKKLLESWISLQGAMWSHYGGDYPARQRKAAYLRAAAEYSRAGLKSESLEMLGRYADAIASTEYSSASQGEADESAILSGLAGLETAERYGLLKDWTIPTNGRATAQAITGVLLADRTPAAFDRVRGSSPRGPRTARMLSSLDLLIAAASDLGLLDDLQKEMEPYAAKKVDNAAVALAMIQIANGQGTKGLDAVKGRNEAYVRKEADQDPYHRRQIDSEVHDSVLARAALLDPNPALQQQGRLLARNVIGHNRTMMPTMRHALGSALVGPEIAGELNGRMSATGLKHWIASATLSDCYEHQEQSLPLWWVAHENMVTHICGMGGDFLCFAYPLQGQFELECEAMAEHLASGNISFGGLIFLGLFDSGRMMYPVGRNNEALRHPDAPRDHNAFNRIKLSVNGDEITYWINGHPILVVKNVAPTSPFFTLYTERHWDSTFHNIRITGTPVVPREVVLVSGNSLLGWACDFYQESQPRFLPPEDDRNQHDDEPPLDKPDWFALDGEVRSPMDPVASLGSAAPLQSRLYYSRSLRDRETLKYEFWYEPGDGGSQAHPALDRLAFLLEPDGVRVHWMTRSNDRSDDNAIPANNAIIEAACRRGPDKLPLKSKDWNQAELAMVDGSLVLTLNGSVVYERPIERDNLRQFGLYHDKSRHAVRVRNVVLSGDWPRTLGPGILDNLFEPTRPQTVQERRALGRVIDEKFHLLAIDRILLKARALPREQRYTFLKDWVLPGDDHDAFRLYGTFAPADTVATAPISFGRPAAHQIQSATTGSAATSGIRQRSGGELIAPARDLIAVAKELGKLDELEMQIRELRELSELNERSRKSMLGLIAISRGDVPDALAQLQALTPDKSVGLSDAWQVHERWSDLLLVWDATRVPALRTAAKGLVELMVESQTRKQPAQHWEPVVRAAEQRLIQYLAGAESIPTGSVVSPQRQWTQVTLADSRSRSAGLMPVWRFDGPHASHLSGYGDDLLYFQSPLRGKFTVECELTTTGGRETRLMYNAHHAGLQHTLDKFDVGNLMSHSVGGKITPKLDLPGEWSRARLEIEPGKAVWYAHDRKIHETKLPAQVDPWLAMHSWGHSGGGVRTIRITGRPEIPSEINLTAPEDLNGWWPGMYLESTDGGEWERSGEEIIGSKHDREQGRHVHSLLQYHRPLLEDGQISYDFFHVPDETHVNPALGRAAFLLEADGVKVHWMTDAQFERTGLEPGNVIVEKECQRGGRLPLKSAAWNNLKLAVKGDVLTLVLNDVLIYERKIEAANQRQFGLFRYAGDCNVRVKNVIYRGDWPKTLPPANEQELGGVHVAVVKRALERTSGERP